jgi:hypothetical protein
MPGRYIGGVDIVAPLIRNLDAGEWSASRPGCFTPGEEAHSVSIL